MHVFFVLSVFHLLIHSLMYSCIPWIALGFCLIIQKIAKPTIIAMNFLFTAHRIILSIWNNLKLTLFFLTTRRFQNIRLLPRTYNIRMNQTKTNMEKKSTLKHVFLENIETLETLKVQNIENIETSETLKKSKTLR